MLNDTQRTAVERLRVSSDISAVPSPLRHLSITERARKMRKVQSELEYPDYMETRFITSTSNICERFFSLAGYAIDNHRRGLAPESFEAQMFSHCNMDKWGVLDVNCACNVKVRLEKLSINFLLFLLNLNYFCRVHPHIGFRNHFWLGVEKYP